MRSGQAFASQLLQQLHKIISRGTRDSTASQSVALQATAMRAVVDRMQQLGLEVYWQPFSSGSGASGARRSAKDKWAMPDGNVTGKGDKAAGRDTGTDGISSGGVTDAGECANLHGVLRSPRGDGKEGLVLATPLALAAPSDDRPGEPLSPHPDWKHARRQDAPAATATSGPPDRQRPDRYKPWWVAGLPNYLCTASSAVVQAGGRGRAGRLKPWAWRRLWRSTWRARRGWPRTSCGWCRTHAAGCYPAWRCAQGHNMVLPRSVHCTRTRGCCHLQVYRALATHETIYSAWCDDPAVHISFIPWKAWLAHYQDGATCSAASDGANRTGDGASAFGRAGQLQQAVLLQASGVAGEVTPAEGGGSSGGSSGGSVPAATGETEAAHQRRAEAAKTLTAPLVGAAGQLPKLDLFYLFRRYLATHGSGLQIDIKVPACEESDNFRVQHQLPFTHPSCASHTSATWYFEPSRGVLGAVPVFCLSCEGVS